MSLKTQRSPEETELEGATIPRFPVCNHEPETAPTFCGKVFFLCWRCSGAAAGVVAGSVAHRFLGIEVTLVLVFVAAVITALDYRYRNRGVLPNTRRFATGFFLGFCLIGVALQATTEKT